jgi:O-antigen ligase
MKLRTLQRVALYILFFSINFEVWDPLNTNGSFSLSKLTGFFYFFTLLPEIPVFINLSNIKKYLWPLLVFFFLLCITNFINVNSVSSEFIDFSILQNILLFVLLINHEKKVPGILEKGLISFAVGSLLVAICFQFGIGVAYQSGRVTVFGDNENTIAIKECISIVVLILVIFENNLSFKRSRYLLLLGLPVMLLLMAQTGSRTGFISFSLMFFVGLLLLKTKHGYFKISIFFFGVIVAYFLWQYLASSDILLERLKSTRQSHDLGGRDRVWDEVVPFVKENLIFGKGESGYTSYMTNITGAFYSPHNVILEVLSYTGITGLFFYVLFLYRIFKISLKKYKKDGSLLQLLLLIPILGLLLSGQLLAVKIGYVIFAFCVSRKFSIKDDKRKFKKIDNTFKLSSV